VKEYRNKEEMFADVPKDRIVVLLRNQHLVKKERDVLEVIDGLCPKELMLPEDCLAHTDCSECWVEALETVSE
jgi:hypothetical protein